jgi:hypothetical protein
VFSPNAYTGGTAGTSFSLGFVPDTLLTMRRNTSNFDILQSRLTGLQYMFTYSTDAEITASSGMPTWDANTGTTKLATATSVTGWNASGSTYVNEAFARAPSFFDEVCYTGTGSARTVAHNLGVVPELMIVKRRDGTSYGDWLVYHSALGNTKYLLLNTTDASATANSGAWNYTNPTSTQFTVGDWESLTSTATYVAYLFATCAGVQYINSYVGDGTTGRTINCGFTGGARFVCIKATSTTGSWWTFDSARGIVTNNDPALQLNSTAAEVTSADAIDTASSGFIVNQEATCSLNASGVTYSVWAIA